MRLISRLARPRNAWSQPPFWSNPSLPYWSSMTGEKETIESSFTDYVQKAMKASGVVFACIAARQFVFSEARFQFRRYEEGRPGKLFDGTGLRLLDRPWTNGTTGELLGRMEHAASLAGNFYATNRTKYGALRVLRSDWVTIITGSPSDDPFDIDAEVVAYVYEPKEGPRKAKPVILQPSEVVHYSPIPDPEAQWRGMSWLTPILDEVKADKVATRHKLKFFEQGATLGVVMSYDPNLSEDQFKAAVASFKAAHEGPNNAYKTLHVAGGADPKVVGTNLQQLEFKATQGAGETRIAAAAGVHPVILGLSEGLQGSALNAGNYAQARRRFADMTIRPLWRMAAASLQTIVDTPEGAHLWYDDRDIPFLREDEKDAADRLNTQAQAIRQLTDAGFDPQSVVDAVETGELSRLAHSGLYSVQLQAPGGAEDQPQMSVADLTLALQKIYLAVGVVISAEEARDILNRGGAGLPATPDGLGAPAPALVAALNGGAKT